MINSHYSEEFIRSITKLTESKFSREGKYFYGSTGYGFRRASGRLYLGTMGQKFPKNYLKTSINFGSISLLCSKSCLIHDEYYGGESPIPIDMFVGISLLLIRFNIYEESDIKC